jgi:large subunit ribosomal protein L47
MRANLVKVKWTQRAIKQVLTERFYSWQDAQVLVKDDPEIDLSGDGPVYNPVDFIEEDAVKEGAEFEGKEAPKQQAEVTPEEPKAKPETIVL